MTFKVWELSQEWRKGIRGGKSYPLGEIQAESVEQAAELAEINYPDVELFRMTFGVMAVEWDKNSD